MKIINWLKGIPFGKWINYGGYVILVGIIFLMAKCDKTTITPEDCRAAMINYGDSVQLATLATMQIEISTDNDLQPQGDTIKAGTTQVETRHYKKLIKNWWEYQQLKKEHQELGNTHRRILKDLDLTRAELDSIGGQEVWTFERVVKEELPIVQTDKSEAGDNYEIKETITSKGQLLGFNRTVTVQPKTITVTKVEKEYLKRHNMVALQFGALYIDETDNIHFTPSVMYARKWFVVEAGPVMSRNWNFEGIETKAGFLIKF